MLLILVLHGLLWVAVNLLQILGQAGCRGGDWTWWQQVPLLQQVDHSQGLWGVGLEAHGRQGRAQLGWPWTTRWLRKGKNNKHLIKPVTAKLFSVKGNPCFDLQMNDCLINITF